MRCVDRLPSSHSFDRAVTVMVVVVMVNVSEFSEIGQRGRVVRLQSQSVFVRPFRLVQLVVDVKYGTQITVVRRVLRKRRQIGSHINKYSNTTIASACADSAGFYFIFCPLAQLNSTLIHKKKKNCQ